MDSVIGLLSASRLLAYLILGDVETGEVLT